MHADEIDVDVDLVRRPVAAQFPAWLSLPLRRVVSSGTVNAIFRMGDQLVARLPRIPRFHYDDTDCWLRALAGRLPLAIPEPVAAGEPGQGYPWRWSVHQWVDGEPWKRDRMGASCAAAEQLAEFVLALQRVDMADARCPPLRPVGSFTTEDAAVRAAVSQAQGIDRRAFLQAWDKALQLPPWRGEPLLVHADLLPGNVLAAGGSDDHDDRRIAAVIDWAMLSVGDPSRDLLPAWTLFFGEASRVFRSLVGFDDETWAQARAWALAFVVGTVYYARTNPAFAEECRSTVNAALVADV